MDTASVVGLAAGTVTLLKLLSKGVLSVNAMLHGVRDVHENIRGFGEGLDAFHFSLTVLDFEISKRIHDSRDSRMVGNEAGRTLDKS